MNSSTSSSRPSGIPRPSRLPVPRAGVRPSPSKDNLQQSSRPSIVNPRLRNPPSRDQLSSSTSSKPRIASTPLRQRDSSRSLRDSEDSTATVIYNPINEQTLRKASDDALFSKPSYSRLREEDQSQLRGEDEMFLEVGTEEFEEQPGNTRDTRRKPRPSLSERAMETLQNIPSSPAVRKQDSNFFNPESPMRPASSGTQSSRPGSSYQSDASMRPPTRTSRPTSRAGHGQPNPVNFRASTNTFRPPKSTSQAHTPLKRPSTSNLKTPSTNRNRTAHASSATSRLPSSGFVSSTQQRSPSPDKTTAKAPTTKSGSKTLSSRPLKPRASVHGLFRKPSMPSLDQSGELDRIGFGPKRKSTTFSNTSSEATSTTSKASKATTTTSVSNPDQDVTPRKSSSALRDQIAKAKAAKRAASKQLSSTEMDNGAEVPVVPTATFDFGLSDDPFNQQPRESGTKGLLRKRIEAARTDGRLNIAAMGFKEIPEEVMNMYNLESIANQNTSWAESVDLTRLVAADNEIELLQDDIFPDVDPRELMEDEDAKGNQFGGLETLDLHGNILIALPLGLRRLELLTTLNLSNNKLGNECFVVISQIPSLRDLKIAGNGLVGTLDSSIAKLQNLEVLDLQRNALTSLPDGLADLVRLRVLNIAENRFNSLPFESLRHLPLIELLAAKNDLTGILVSAGVDELPQLQVLDITDNALKSLTAAETLSLPSLHQLNCSSNRLTCLPDVASWLSLRTLLAEENNIASIPEGFTKLPSLMNVNLSGNNIKILDDGIGAMENLSIFRISGNPLREKKFAGMSTEELKRVLKARMEPAEPEIEKDSEADGTFYSAPVSPISPRPSSDWPVKTGGVLDRSNTKSYSLNPVAAADVAANNTVKIVELHHNMFQEIPSSIAFFAVSLTTLSLAHNELSSDTFMKDALDLPALKELNLSSNTFSSVQPLIQRLKASMLERLDISFNRLTSLPPLKPHFPSLITLLVSNNTIKELSPESVKGLRTLDCSSNDINSLNARIGLLGGPGGLEKLDVSGNRFRVPKYTILEKGTEATLAWLRDRIPADEISSTELD